MPKRYFCDCPVSGDRGTVVPAVEQESGHGEYVRFDDYQRSRAWLLARALRLRGRVNYHRWAIALEAGGPSALFGRLANQSHRTADAIVAKHLGGE